MSQKAYFWPSTWQSLFHKVEKKDMPPETHIFSTKQTFKKLGPLTSLPKSAHTTSRSSANLSEMWPHKGKSHPWFVHPLAWKWSKGCFMDINRTLVSGLVCLNVPKRPPKSIKGSGTKYWPGVVVENCLPLWSHASKEYLCDHSGHVKICFSKQNKTFYFLVH